MVSCLQHNRMEGRWFPSNSRVFGPKMCRVCSASATREASDPQHARSLSGMHVANNNKTSGSNPSPSSCYIAQHIVPRLLDLFSTHTSALTLSLPSLLFTLAQLVFDPRMTSRSGESPMDFAWENGKGPIDHSSPFITAFQRSKTLPVVTSTRQQSSGLHGKRTYIHPQHLTL